MADSTGLIRGFLRDRLSGTGKQSIDHPLSVYLAPDSQIQAVETDALIFGGVKTQAEVPILVSHIARPGNNKSRDLGLPRLVEPFLAQFIKRFLSGFRT